MQISQTGMLESFNFETVLTKRFQAANVADSDDGQRRLDV